MMFLFGADRFPRESRDVVRDVQRQNWIQCLVKLNGKTIRSEVVKLLVD